MRCVNVFPRPSRDREASLVVKKVNARESRLLDSLAAPLSVVAHH